MSKIDRGMYVRDIVTNLEGYVTEISQIIYGDVQYQVQPKGDGTKIADGSFFDEDTLVIIPEVEQLTFKEAQEITTELGCEYTSIITGFKGIATEIRICQNGCIMVGLAPSVNEKNERANAVIFSQKVLKKTNDGINKKAKELEDSPKGAPMRRSENVIG